MPLSSAGGRLTIARSYATTLKNSEYQPREPVTVRHQPTMPTAGSLPQDILPQKITRLSMYWGASSSYVWAIGEDRGIWMWDGARWSQQASGTI